MERQPAEFTSDLWSEWLLHRRHAGNPDYDRTVRTTIEGYVRRVLDRAQLEPGMTLLDVGCGDGAVGLTAIDRVGPSLRAILTDISLPLLRHAETAATQRGVREQCTFVQLAADRLTPIAEASVDVVTTRAVLAYVADKPAAFEEFYRVLKPGGRISLGEPIFRDDALKAISLRKAVESQPADRLLRLLQLWKGAQFPDTDQRMAHDPLTNYSERDLVQFAVSAGFVEIRLSFEIDVLPSNITLWETLIGFAPHPHAPTLATIMAERFTAEERQLFERTLRPLIESGQFTTTERVAYLAAVKPRV